MANKINLSIIICTFNRSHLLQDVLAELERQMNAGGKDQEVLVVDNNSTDNTKEVVEPFIARNHNRFRYLFEERQGKSYALNKAIKKARSDWLLFTDDDIKMSHNWMKVVCQEIYNRRALKCFFGKISSDWQAPRPAWFHDRMRSVIVNADHGEVFRPKMNYLVGANMGIHRSVFRKHGYFNEDIKRFEDSELSLRIAQNVDIAYIPQAVVHHPVSGQRLTKSYFRKWYFEMGQIIDSRTLAVEDKKIWGIPRWVYRAFFTKLFLWLKPDPAHERFYLELQLWRYLGTFNAKWFTQKRIK